MVELTEQCVAGVIFNWSEYLLNGLIDYVEQGQEEDKAKFHYSWPLILISFILWSNLLDYQPLNVPILCIGAKY